MKSLPIKWAAILTLLIAFTGTTAAQSTRLAPRSDRERSMLPPRYVILDNVNDRNLELILSEDFSLMTAGTTETPDELHLTESFLTTGDPHFDDKYTHTPGWSGVGLYQAGGAVALAYPGFGGTINTPEGVYSGTIIVKVMLKALGNPDGHKQLMAVTMNRGGVMYPTMVEEKEPNLFNISPADGWVEKYIEITNPYNDKDCFIQFNGMLNNDKGFVIDKIEVFRDMDYLPAPTSLKASGFTETGFTATWDAVVNADGYAINCYKETCSDKETFSVTEHFEDVEIQDGQIIPGESLKDWEISLSGDPAVTLDGGANNSKGLVLCSDNDYICTPDKGGRYDTFSFVVRALATGEYGGYLVIDVKDAVSGEWKMFAFMRSSVFDNEDYPIDVNAFEEEYPKDYAFKGLFSAVRIRLEDSYGEKIVIDDIAFSISSPTERVLYQENITTTDNLYTFTNLDPQAEYYFNVRALKGTSSSEFSELKHAFGIATPNVEKASELDARGGFTANWNPVTNADSYKVETFEIQKIDQDTDQYVILHEDFSKVSSNATMDAPEVLGNDYEYIPLDDYTNTPDWNGRGNIIANGMLGCQQDPYSMSEIVTPILCLDNNDGVFNVSLKAYSVAGENIVIQGNGVFERCPFTETGLKEFNITLTNGLKQGRLMIYTENGSPFLIDEFKVSQDLKSGDELISQISTLEDITTSQARVSFTPKEQMLYGYRVYASRSYFNQKCESEPSEIELVDFSSLSIDAINACDFSAYSVNGGIMIHSDSERSFNIYNPSGAKIISLSHKSGDHFISLASGIYILTSEGKELKLMVR